MVEDTIFGLERSHEKERSKSLSKYFRFGLEEVAGMLGGTIVKEMIRGAEIGGKVWRRHMIESSKVVDKNTVQSFRMTASQTGKLLQQFKRISGGPGRSVDLRKAGIIGGAGTGAATGGAAGAAKGVGGAAAVGAGVGAIGTAATAGISIILGTALGAVIGILKVIAESIMDFPIVVAIMKILKLIMMILLLPLIPILKPVLLLLAQFAKFMMRPDFQEKWSAIFTFILGIFFGWIGKIVEVGKALYEVFKVLWPIIKSVANTFMNFASLIMTGIVNFVKDIQGGANPLVALYDNIIKPAYEFFANIIVTLWNDYLQPNLQSLVTSFEWGVILLTVAWNNLVNYIDTQMWDKYIKPALETFTKNVEDKLFKDVVKPGFEAAMNELKTWAKNVVAEAREKVEKLLSGPKKTAESIATVVTSAAIGGAIAGPVGALIGAMTSISKVMTPIAKSTPSYGFSTGPSFSKSTGSALVDKILKVSDAIISPGGRIVTTDPADYLIATKDPAALSGAGRGTVITINVNNAKVSDMEDIKKLTQEISKTLQKQFRGNVSYGNVGY